MESPIRRKFDIYACIPTLNMITKNDPDQSTGSGKTHISQMGILGSRGHGASDSHQILYLELYANHKLDF